MKKVVCVFAAVAVLAGSFVMTADTAAWGKADPPAKKAPAKKPVKTEIERMSIFLSNFTEVGLFNVEVDWPNLADDGELLHVKDNDAAPDLIRFGIRHNYINNFKSRIRLCSDRKCEYGSLTVAGDFVAESVKKYFDLKIKNRSVLNSEPMCFFDGKSYHFEGADGDDVYYADVKKVTKEGKVVYMSGDIYNTGNREDRPATFEAAAKPYKWKGTDTWSLLYIRTDWK